MSSYSDRSQRTPPSSLCDTEEWRVANYSLSFRASLLSQGGVRTVTDTTVLIQANLLLYFSSSKNGFHGAALQNETAVVQYLSHMDENPSLDP